jgi:hypothetical protein
VTNQSAARRGPQLPYSVVAGVTPCGNSWLVASAKLQGTLFAPEAPQLLKPFSEVLDQRPSFAVIALNAPVGYLDATTSGGRTCDRQARALLGSKRGSSIKSAPIRSRTDELDFLPEHLDAISMTLLPRYQEVAAEMAPFRQRTVYEVHSDTTFYEMNNSRPMEWPKESQKGIDERRALLEVNLGRGHRGRFFASPLGRCCLRVDCAQNLRSSSNPDAIRPRVGRPRVAHGDPSLIPTH